MRNSNRLVIRIFNIFTIATLLTFIVFVTALVSGKHNYVLRVAADSIARKLGNTLIAPIVPFVPEGIHTPPSGHMRYPGTISLTEATFEKLLK